MRFEPLETLVALPRDVREIDIQMKLSKLLVSLGQGEILAIVDGHVVLHGMADERLDHHLLHPGFTQ